MDRNSLNSDSRALVTHDVRALVIGELTQEENLMKVTGVEVS